MNAWLTLAKFQWCASIRLSYCPIFTWRAWEISTLTFEGIYGTQITRIWIAEVGSRRTKYFNWKRLVVRGYNNFLYTWREMWEKDYLNIMLSCLTYFEDAEMKFKSKCKYVYWNTLFVEIYFNFYMAEILLIRRKTLSNQSINIIFAKWYRGLSDNAIKF